MQRTRATTPSMSVRINASSFLFGEQDRMWHQVGLDRCVRHPEKPFTAIILLFGGSAFCRSTFFSTDIPPNNSNMEAMEALLSKI